MSQRHADLLLTALAPVVWGTTYIVSTEFLPGWSPLTVAMLRALPAGLLLMALARRWPWGIWWWRSLVLGALNFSLFWIFLFTAAYRLPGGVAATLGSVQPLVVLVLAAVWLGTPIRAIAVAGALLGVAGVALLVLGPGAQLDALGAAAGLAGAVSMACGTVLTRKWQPPVPVLTFTAWQLLAGGLLLVPVVALWAPATPAPSLTHLLGLGWLSVIGAALTCMLMFRGIARLGPATCSMLALLSPVTAMLLGWVFLRQPLSPMQWMGAALVLAGIVLGQRAAAAGPPGSAQASAAD